MHARFTSLWDRCLFMARADWAYALGALGLILGIAPMVPGWPTLASLMIGLAGALLALGTFAYDTRALSKRVRKRILSPLDPLFSKTPRDTLLTEHRRVRGETLSSNTIDSQLPDTAPQTPIQILVDTYRLPSDLSDLAPYVLTKTTTSRWPFNGNALGLVSDLDPRAPDRTVRFQPASYFDFLCSNELMKWRVTHDGTVDTPAYRHMVDEHGNLVRLAESQLANIVGVSTIAITSDRQLLTVLQTHGNSASGGLFAPSGSGSLESGDADGVDTLAQIVAAGATREMVEETGIPADLIGETSVIGFARWLDRGGKPEFFAVTELLAPATEIDRRLRRIDSRERIFTGGVRWFSLDAALDSLRGRELDSLKDATAFEIFQSSSLPLNGASTPTRTRSLIATNAKPVPRNHLCVPVHARDPPRERPRSVSVAVRAHAATGGCRLRIDAHDSQQFEVPDMADTTVMPDASATAAIRASSKGTCSGTRYVASGRQVEGQGPAREGWQHLALKPAAQHLTLRWVRSLLGNNSALDLADGQRSDELVRNRRRRRPSLDGRDAPPHAQRGDDIGVQDVLGHSSGARAVSPRRSGSNSMSAPSSLASISASIKRTPSSASARIARTSASVER